MSLARLTGERRTLRGRVARNCQIGPPLPKTGCRIRPDSSQQGRFQAALFVIEPDLRVAGLARTGPSKRPVRSWRDPSQFCAGRGLGPERVGGICRRYRAAVPWTPERSPELLEPLAALVHARWRQAVRGHPGRTQVVGRGRSMDPDSSPSPSVSGESARSAA